MLSLHAGDTALMNLICFDAFALGNREFDHGDAALAGFLDLLAEGSCNTAVLSANVVPHDTSWTPAAEAPSPMRW